MAKLKLKEKDLTRLGYPQGKVIGIAINVMLKHYRRMPKEEALDLLRDILEEPESYEADPNVNPIVRELLDVEVIEEEREEISLSQDVRPYPIFGKEGIESVTTEQMDLAMRLPVVAEGALMPDAHLGYGLPIGGVLAVENAVIPYGVGMDIGCRMCLSIFDLKPKFLERDRNGLKDMLIQNTRFGAKSFDQPFDDEVLERSEFKEIKVVKKLRQKARQQIGSSGSGNHFVEFGLVEVKDPDNGLGLREGMYVGVLSHSGSRGMGAAIARHYTDIAMQTCLLPKAAKPLAWLDLDSEAGQEYWLAMNLAGDYASACHHHIHRRLGHAIAEEPIAVIENHHNFAWKERLPDGREVIVHRKGATPAGKGVLGIIPGSMTAPAFIVRGKGNRQSLQSASHGAGRRMSRNRAKASFTYEKLKKHLREHRVELIGGGMDEVPFSYKDIHQVMAYQSRLVDVLGSFTPKIVRMDK